VASRTRSSRTNLPQDQDQEGVEGHQTKPVTNFTSSKISATRSTKQEQVVVSVLIIITEKIRGQ
jgi:hypothetical protein